MAWLWINHVLAAVGVVWGLRRMLRNRSRLMNGGRERYPSAARIAVAAGLAWIPLYLAIVLTFGPKIRQIERQQAITDIRAVGGRIPQAGGYVDLSGTKITDEHLQLLIRVPELEEVFLTNTRVTDAGVKYLEFMPRLQKVHVAGTAITAEGLARIQAHVALVELNMRHRLAAAEERQRAHEAEVERQAEERELAEKLGAAKSEEEMYEKAVAEKQKFLEGSVGEVR